VLSLGPDHVRVLVAGIGRSDATLVEPDGLFKREATDHPIPTDDLNRELDYMGVVLAAVSLELLALVHGHSRSASL
jgi:hypothetical protein